MYALGYDGVGYVVAANFADREVSARLNVGPGASLEDLTGARGPLQVVDGQAGVVVPAGAAAAFRVVRE